MVFSSSIFLFFFLPLVLLLYTLAPRKMKNLLLLSASLIFYAWGESIYLLVMIFSILFNYACGIFMFHRHSDTPHKSIFILGLFLNLGVLGFFKYGNFLIDNLNTLIVLTGLQHLSMEAIHLPIGISFFTFQAMSYLIDVYRGVVPAQRNLINLGLYISLFPQLIAGPIIRYHDIAKEIITRRITRPDFAYGVQRFLFGLGKKVLLANPIAAIADKIFLLPAHDLSTPVAWLGAGCYTLQIYFDFSGYSDMAIGLGRMFGFHFLENFNYPYISKSIREFWRRWHISLANWLKDYLYIPLGGSRKGQARTYINLFIVFILCGLWHGANWTFAIWGLYHGFFLVIERTGLGKLRDRMWSPLQQTLTLLLIIIGWVLFRTETIGDAGHYLSAMFGFSPEPGAKTSVAMLIDSKAMLEISIALLLCLPVYPAILNLKKQADQRFIRFQPGIELGFQFILFVLIGCIVYFTLISLAAGAYNPFIYFRF